MNNTVSPSLENYLKTILKLEGEGHYARVTDLAERLGIAKSSVNQAIGILKKQGMVKHEKYGPLELTDKGEVLARDIERRHNIVMKFLTVILKVDITTAECDACLMEHAISAVTVDKLSEFINEYNGKADDNESDECIKSRREYSGLKRLDNLKPGTRARVVKIAALKKPLGGRLAGMGINPGAEITVEGLAPMGDPIEVKVRGYILALRKTEARDILVEVIE